MRAKTERSRNFTQSLTRSMVALSVLAVVSGCQSFPFGSQDANDGTSKEVMALWSTYQHCRASSDAFAMETDARQLSAAAARAVVLEPSPIPLPALLSQHVIDRPPRYSVDPVEMAASCSLFAGQAALKEGRPDVAAELFRLVLEANPEDDYGYYVTQARKGLSEAELTSLVSGPATATPVSGSTPDGGLPALPTSHPLH